MCIENENGVHAEKRKTRKDCSRGIYCMDKDLTKQANSPPAEDKENPPPPPSPRSAKKPEQKQTEKTNSENPPDYGTPCGQPQKCKNQKTAETQCFSGLSHRSDWI